MSPDRETEGQRDGGSDELPFLSVSPSLCLFVSPGSQRLRLADEIDELGAVAAGVGAEGGAGDFFHGGKVAGAAVLAAAEDHAKAGDGGGELQIGRGGVERVAAILERVFEQLARVAVRFLVAELEREQLAGGGGVGQFARALTSRNATAGVPYSCYPLMIFCTAHPR